MALAALMTISGCAAPIRESKTPLSGYVDLYIEGWLDETHPAVRITGIQIAGEPSTHYVPSSSHADLWLRPGAYEGTVECYRPRKDAYTIPILEKATPLDPDGKLRFTVKYHGVTESRLALKFNTYSIDCATSPDGKPEFVVASIRYEYDDD